MNNTVYLSILQNLRHSRRSPNLNFVNCGRRSYTKVNGVGAGGGDQKRRIGNCTELLLLVRPEYALLFVSIAFLALQGKFETMVVIGTVVHPDFRPGAQYGHHDIQLTNLNALCNSGLDNPISI